MLLLLLMLILAETVTVTSAFTALTGTPSSDSALKTAGDLDPTNGGPGVGNCSFNATRSSVHTCETTLLQPVRDEQVERVFFDHLLPLLTCGQQLLTHRTGHDAVSAKLLRSAVTACNDRETQKF